MLPPTSQIQSMSNKKIGGTNQFVDLFLVYQFMKRIITPFEKWPAFELGIIDKDGNVLKKKNQLQTRQEKEAWGYYDVVTSNLKKILGKLPGGKSRLASIAAATFLFKEHRNIDFENTKLVEAMFNDHLRMIIESEVPANAMGTSSSDPATGNIDLREPLLFKKGKKPLIFRRKIKIK